MKNLKQFRAACSGRSELTLVYSDSGFELYYECKSDEPDELWIMFGSYQGRTPAGRHFLTSRGSSALHVVSKVDDWYQDPRFAKVLYLLQAVRDVFPGRVIAFGTSMGGFGALAFARDLRPECVITGGPQATIDISVTRRNDERWDAQWEALAGEGLYRPDVAASSPFAMDVYIAYDPFQTQDAWHASRLAPLARVNLLPLPFAGHEVFVALKQTGLWLAFLEAAALSQSEELRALTRQFSKRKRDNAGYWFMIGRTLMNKPGKNRTAEFFLRRSCEVMPDFPESYFWLSVSLQNQSRFDEAIAAARQGVDVVAGRPLYWGLYERLAHAYVTAGDQQNAEAVYDEALTAFPDFPELLFSQAEILRRRLGSHPKVIEIFEHVVQGAPANSRFRQGLDEVLAQAASDSS